MFFYPRNVYFLHVVLPGLDASENADPIVMLDDDFQAVDDLLASNLSGSVDNAEPMDLSPNYNEAVWKSREPTENPTSALRDVQSTNVKSLLVSIRALQFN